MASFFEHLLHRQAAIPAPPPAPVPQAVAPTTIPTPAPAKAEESTIMATAPVTPAPVSAFTRFIDAIGNFFHKAAPAIKEVESVAVAAEPFLALSPFGPEYTLVVNAIIGVQQTANASLAAGTALTNQQKMGLVLQAVTPGVTTILASKGITEPPAVEAAIPQFVQNVFNIQAGPVAVTAPPATPPPAAG